MTEPQLYAGLNQHTLYVATDRIAVFILLLALLDNWAGSGLLSKLMLTVKMKHS
jgi:hypothetical protein